MLRRATLNWVNEQRKIDGLPPLEKLSKGKRGDPYGCVIANSFGDHLGLTAIHPTERSVVVNDRVVRLPWYAFYDEFILLYR